MFPLRKPLVAGGRFLLDGLLPRLCPGCGAERVEERWICLACRRRFRPGPLAGFCPVCRRESRGEDPRAGLRCLDPEHAWGVVVAAFRMADPVDRILHAFKYEGRRDLARPLGRLLARGLLPDPTTLVVPLPLHRVRRRERGYNHAEDLARVAARVWRCPLAPELLERGRATRVQARLTGEDRLRNLAGAFRVPDPGEVAGERILLVDDVATTGATLVEAAEALRRAGARAVGGTVVALA